MISGPVQKDGINAFKDGITYSRPVLVENANSAVGVPLYREESDFDSYKFEKESRAKKASSFVMR